MPMHIVFKNDDKLINRKIPKGIRINVPIWVSITEKEKFNFFSSFLVHFEKEREDT